MQPHYHRRYELLQKYPEIKKLYGHTWLTAIIVALVTGIQFVISIFIGSSWVLIITLSYLIGAILNHWCAMAIHEASHNLVFTTSNQNRFFAIICNFPLVFPAAMTFFRYHHKHHTQLGTDVDNDLPTEWEIKHIGNNTIKKFLWVLFFFFFGTLARGFIRKPNKYEVLNIFIQIVINVMIILVFGWHALYYLALSTFFSMSMHPIAGHYLHEHYSFTDDKQETYSYYGILNYFTFNVGYHNEHHDFPTIPWTNLPELHKIANKEYSSLTSHNSWSEIMYRFITDPTMGHFSRIRRKRNIKS